MEETLIEVPSYAVLLASSERSEPPTRATILGFRQRLEKHNLGVRIFETVKTHLS